MVIEGPSPYGILINNTDNGIDINGSTNDVMTVRHSERDGVYIGGSLRYDLVLNSFNSSFSSNPDLEDHMALIRSTAGPFYPKQSLLAMQAGMPDPGSGINYISFYGRENFQPQDVGAIEGNGTVGITFKSGGADFAEYLQVFSKDEKFKPGDTVGITGGKITLKTQDSDYLKVITDQPIVVGNQPEDYEGYEIVSFIGQVDVRVRGVVKAGEWIVASGQNDGTGVAIKDTEINLNHNILGRAWESSTDQSVKRTRTAIGMDQSSAINKMIRNMQESMIDQINVNRILQEQIDELKTLLIKVSN